MERQLVYYAAVLGGLNLLAMLMWIATCRSRLVLGRPRAKREAATPALDGWIDEVERAESADPALAGGSEAWWRAWAAAGGEWPQAASACRSGAAPDGHAARRAR